MMQHARASIQVPDETFLTRCQKPTNGFGLILDPRHQEVRTTTSRRTRRGDFLRAAQWALTTRLHPKAGDTTWRVAKDLATRMNADGHVAYCRDAMYRRLGISRRTLERHVAVLRELGLLVWDVHGNRTNTRPPGSGSWAGTATIYAAVVPPAWDEALGHRVEGRGYHARHIGFTPRGRERAIAEARGRTRRGPRRDAPSCRTNHSRRTAEEEGRKNYTARSRRARSRSHPPKGPSEAVRFTPAEASGAMSIAAFVRPRVPWSQGEGLRRLAFALRPWIRTGRSAAEIAAELAAWCVSRRPSSPAALILAHGQTLADRTTPHREPPAPETPRTGVQPNQAFLEALGELVDAPFTPTAPEPDPPAFVIRNRILASIAEAGRAWRDRDAGQCRSYAEWEAVCEARGRSSWLTVPERGRERRDEP
jgi:DNA-binding transcriptional ArsR family regulator